MFKIAALLSASFLWVGSHAFNVYTNDTVPANLTTNCANALSADVACDFVVPALQAGSFYPKSTLQRACTSSCADALAGFQSNINSACEGQSWSAYDDEILPVAVIPDLLRYHYNFTCLTDGELFCNNVAAAYAVYLDPDTAADPNKAPAGGLYGNITISSDCDICLIKNLQFQAGSPYYNGPDLYSSSVYQSRTSSCSVIGYPLTTNPNTIVTPTSTNAPQPTCAGTTYQVSAEDDCHSVSLSQGIGTTWLLQDNSLSSGCTDFPTSGELCLVNKCDVYTVKTNDTCSSIAKSQKVTVPQLKAWNPSINAGCYNIDQMVGDQICINQPGPKYTPPSGCASATPSATITQPPAPSDIANGTNTYCARFHDAVVGEYCNTLMLRYGISLSDFRFLNPSVNENCTNLYANESYCVQPVGDINTYPGRPGYTSYTAVISSITGDPATSLPTVNWTAPTPTTTTMPLASGTRDDCWRYFNGSHYQNDITDDNTFRSECDLAATVLGVTLEDLGTWNPSLGNTSLSNCTFKPNTRYCGIYYFGEKQIATPVDDSSPIRENTTSTCDQYLDVWDGSGYTCQDILDLNNITIAEFYKWNPSVKSDCSGLWPGYQYCVRGPGYQLSSSTISASSTTASSTATNTPPGPTQTGQPTNCNKWYIAQDNDSCVDISAEYSITSDEFFDWNPAAHTDCSGLWPTYAYCVGTTDSTPSTTKPASTASTPTSTGSSIPDPHQQGNAVGNCNKYAQAQDGDGCEVFAERNGITTTQLYTWNTVLGNDGSGCASSFWTPYWYCVGVSS